MLYSHTLRRCTVAGFAGAALVLCSPGIRAQNYYPNHDPYADRYHNGRYDAYSPVAEIEPGAYITVRTNEAIDTDKHDGRVYPATVQEDVWDNYNRLAVPMIRRGSPATLIAREGRNGELVLDLDSVTVNGRRYSVSTLGNVVGTSGRQDDFLHNDKTPAYVGGGAILGTIVGALTGGGKGAAIGAVGGAAAGAGAEYLTQGREVRVPAGTVLTFRLDEPLTVAAAPNRNNGNDRRDRDRNGR